jgi:hypothetical protein
MDTRHDLHGSSNSLLNFRVLQLGADLASHQQRRIDPNA